MTDEIRLSGLAAHAFHGVLPAERAAGQPFLVDAVLEGDFSAAGRSDELADTVDYAALVGDLHAVLTGRPVALLETLAERLAEVCLRRPAVTAVRITVHKPQAPVGPAVADIAVRIRRVRG